MSMTHSKRLPIEDVIDQIVVVNKRVRDFWRDGGWAPNDAAAILSRSRLDWQVSLSRSLRRWIQLPTDEELAATQILGYANVGALVEGTLKLFLAVYYENYQNDANAVMRKEELQDPDGLSMEPLRNFFQKAIWEDRSSDNWDPWIRRIQSRRNAVHSFKSRQIGTHRELVDDIRVYLRFVHRINGQLPYPDEYPQYEYGYYYLETETDAPAPGSLDYHLDNK